MLLDFSLLAIGLVVLLVTADKFVQGAASLAKSFGVSTMVIGLTIVGLGTSAPEILVSVIASLQGNTGLAVGNAIGSNIANIGLIVGCGALVAPLLLHSQLVRRELPILMVVSLFCYLLTFDGLGVVDGVLMLSGLVAFLLWAAVMARRKKTQSVAMQQAVLDDSNIDLGKRRAYIFFVLGLAGLLISSKVIVWAAVNIAHTFGVSDLVIGLSIIAFGTSLPELAATITCVLKKQYDLAIGNVVGSNLYNLLLVYALPGLIAPAPVAQDVLYRDFPVMLVFTATLLLLGCVGTDKKRQISRLEGGVLLLGFVCYQYAIYHSVIPQT